jgi:hypothetical protein
MLAAACGIVCVLYTAIFLQTEDGRDFAAMLMWLVGALMYLLIALRGFA